MVNRHRYVIWKREAGYGETGSTILFRANIAGENMRLNPVRSGVVKTRETASRFHTERRRFVSGAIDFFPNVLSIPSVLFGTVGKPDSSLVGTTGGNTYYRHYFYPIVTQSSIMSSAIEVRRQVRSHEYIGLVSTGFQFDAALADEFGLRVNLIGKDELEPYSSVDEVLPPKSLWLPREPGSAVGLTISIDIGAGYQEFNADQLGLSYSFKKSLITPSRFDTPIRIKNSLEARINGFFNWIYDSKTAEYYEHFRNNLDFKIKAVVVETQAAINREIIFENKKCRFTGDTPSLQSHGATPIRFPFVALYDGNSEKDSYSIQVVNTVASYS